MASGCPGYGYIVTKLGDRFGKWDDENVIYSAHDPEQKINRRVVTWVALGHLGTVVALAIASRLVGKGVAAGVGLVLALAFVVSYVIWRRRRNRRLTGSPDTWPSAGTGE